MSLFVHDWSVVSPLGVGRDAFAAAVIDQVSDGGAPTWGDVPARETLFGGAFDKKNYLGKKGVRGMDPSGAYATTCSHLLATAHSDMLRHDHSKVGVVLGTGSGSLKSQIDFIRDMHAQERVEWVDPLQFPKTVMNCAAGQVSIWHQFTGVNTTVSSGHHSGVTAFEYADNLFADRRVDRALIGSVEEYSVYSHCLFANDQRSLRESQQLGEGCVTFLATPARSRGTLAELFGYRRLVYLRGRHWQQRVNALERLIDSAIGARPDAPGLRRICFNAFSYDEPQIIQHLQHGPCAAAGAHAWCSNGILGDCLAATTGFQLGLLLAAQTRKGEKSGVDLALSFDPTGGIAVTFIDQRVNI